MQAKLRRQQQQAAQPSRQQVAKPEAKPKDDVKTLEEINNLIKTLPDRKEQKYIENILWDADPKAQGGNSLWQADLEHEEGTGAKKVASQDDKDNDTESDEEGSKSIGRDEVLSSVWRRISRWRKREVTYSELKIKEYIFTNADIEEGYFKDILNKQGSLNQVRMPKIMGREPMRQMLVRFEENYRTGCKYIRVAMRQWFSNKRSNQNLDTHSMLFFVYDPYQDKYVSQFETLYDVTDQFMDSESCFTNDIFLTKGHVTFYFKKINFQDPADNKFKKAFQLYRHKMTEPVYMPGKMMGKLPEPQGESIMEGYRIILEDERDVDSYQIQFMKDSSKSAIINGDADIADNCSQFEFLKGQYVIITEKLYEDKPEKKETEVLIYNLQNCEKPFISSKEKDIYIKDFQTSFAIVDPNSTSIIFSVKGFEYDYIFEHDTLTLDYEFSEQKRVRTFRRIENHEINLNTKPINLPMRDESFNQVFFVQHHDAMQYQQVYPLHSCHFEQISPGVYNKQSEVEKEVNRIWHYRTKGKTLYCSNEAIVFLTQEHLDNLFTEVHEEDHDDFDTYLSLKDCILKCHFDADHIKIWQIKPDYTHNNFENILENLEKEGNKRGQHFVFQQFHSDNRKFYQQQQFRNNDTIIPNQYLKNVQLHKKKKDIILAQNSAIIKGKEYEVDQSKLLLNLGSDEGLLSMIQLWNKDTVKDVRLMKYHCSSKAQNVAFFFLQRNEDKKFRKTHNDVLESGVYFYMVKSFADLKKLAQNNTDPDSMLLNENSIIYAFLDMAHQVKMRYNKAKLKPHQDNGISFEETRNHFTFETVHDNDNPIDNYIPIFLMDRTSNKEFYKTYFCFFDLAKFKTQYQEADDEEDQVNPKDFLVVFESQQFKNTYEQEGEQTSLIWKDIGKKGCPASMFTRCSNWERNLSKDSRNFKSKTEEWQYSARFMVGGNYLVNYHQFGEIKEFLITFDVKEASFDNIDQAQIYKDPKFIKCPIQIEPIALRQFCTSASLQELNGCKDRQMAYLHRLIPKFDDDGNYSGSYLMHLNWAFYGGYFALMDSEEEIEHGFKKRMHTASVEIKSRKGQRFKQTGLMPGEDKDLIVMFDDGYQCAIPDNIIQNYEEGIKKRELIPPEYRYGIIELSGQAVDNIMKLKTSMFQLGFQKVCNETLPQQYTMVSVSRFNKKVIEDEIFDRNELMCELYLSQRNNLKLAIPNFDEIYFLEFKFKKDYYFQPRLLYGGKSHCSVDFPIFETDVKQLGKAMRQEKTAELRFLGCNNSWIECLYENLQAESFVRKAQCAQGFLDSYCMNFYNNFLYNLDDVSLIQKCIDKGYTKPLYAIVDYLLRQENREQYRDMIMTDLPQLLCQDKVQLLNFFTPQVLDQEEDDANDDVEIFEKFACTIDIPLNNPDLPFLGEDETKFSVLKIFKNNFMMREEIEDQLRREAESKTEEADDEGPQMELEHCYFNFNPMIRKIKIDKFSGRKASSARSTEYLEKIDALPQDFDNIDDIFLAYLLSRQENENFFNCKLAHILIDRQFEVTQWLLSNLLKLYCWGFMLPLVLMIYVKGWERHVLHWIAFLTLTFFQYLEYAEIKYEGIEGYLTEAWNYIDSSQFLIYVALMICDTRAPDSYETSSFQMTMNLIHIFLLIQCILKLLQYIRYDDRFTLLVEMLLQVFVDIGPFLVFFFTFVLVNTFMLDIMRAEIDDGDYEAIPRTFLMTFLQIFRNSIGDIAVFGYGDWVQAGGEGGVPLSGTIQIVVLWLIWYMNVFVMVIVLLNFLIAEVSATYETVKEGGDKILYAKRAELNFMTQEIYNLFGRRSSFRVIVHTAPRAESEEDPNAGIVENVVESVQKMMTKQRQDMSHIVKTRVQKTQSHMTAHIDNLFSRLEAYIHRVESKLTHEISELKR